MEKLILKEGKVQNTNFADYKTPTTLDSCPVSVHLIESMDEHGPFGAKGVGEPAMIPSAAATANAIHDAVGVWVTELPITPEKLLKAIKEKQKNKK